MRGATRLLALAHSYDADGRRQEQKCLTVADWGYELADPMVPVLISINDRGDADGR
jgi:hypothetical protein